MHRLWKDYLVGRSPLWWRSSDLIVPIGETLPDVPIIPPERSHDKPENTPWPSRAAAKTATARKGNLPTIGNAASLRRGCGL
jgi:hypothetical protein